MVDFVIAADVHAGLADGIPPGAGKIFLKQARVIGRELHRRGADAVDLGQTAVFIQIPLAFGPLATGVEDPVGHASVTQIQAFAYVDRITPAVAVERFDGKSVQGANARGIGVPILFLHPDRRGYGEGLRRQRQQVDVQDILVLVGDAVEVDVAIIKAGISRRINHVKIIPVNPAAGESVVQIGKHEPGGQEQVVLDPAFGEGMGTKHVVGGALLVGDILLNRFPRPEGQLVGVVQIAYFIAHPRPVIHFFIVIGQVELERVRRFINAVNSRIHVIDVPATGITGIMDRPPEGRTFIAIPVAVAVFESDLRKVWFGQPRLKGNQAAIQRQRVARQRIRKLRVGDVSSGAGIPGAEILKVDTDKTEIIANQTEADTVIVIVKNGVSVQREGGLLGHLIFVVQVLDAAKDPRVELFPLDRLVRVTLRQHGAGGKLDPVVVAVGAAFIPLLRRDGVTRPCRWCAEDNQGRADDIPAEAGFPPPARSGFDFRYFFFIGFRGVG